MSAFEFVLVSFAIILGFGISEILAGWGEQIRSRDRIRPYPLQIASSAYVLVLSMVYLWNLWLTREVAWTIVLYLIVAAPALALALAAHVTRVDTAIGAPEVHAQYFQNSGPVYCLLAVFPLSVIGMSFVPALRDPIPDPPNLALVSLIRLMMLAVLLSLARSKRARVHWIGLAFTWLVAAGFVTRLTFRLVGAAG